MFIDVERHCCLGPDCGHLLELIIQIIFVIREMLMARYVHPGLLGKGVRSLTNAPGRRH